LRKQIRRYILQVSWNTCLQSNTGLPLGLVCLGRSADLPFHKTRWKNGARPVAAAYSTYPGSEPSMQIATSCCFG